MRPVVANRRFDRRRVLCDRLTSRRNSISTNRSRHNKRLSIVNNKWFKCVGRTFDNGLLSLDKIENVDRVSSFVRCRTCEPVSARFDKLQLVKSCALLSPSWAFRNRLYLIDQVLTKSLGVSIPGDVHQPVVDMNRPWQTIQTHSVPIPQLERKYVGSRTDFKDHTVLS